MAADAVDLPAIGSVKRQYLYGAVALVVGIVGYAWWEHKNSGPRTITSDALPDVGEPAQTGGAYTNPRPVTSTVDNTNPDQIRTNTDWTRAVTDKLALLNYDTAHVGAVIGKYLGGLGLTADEADLIRTAWAYAGKPPEGPATIRTVGDGTHPGVGPLPAPAVTATRVGPSLVTLTWPGVPGATAYRVREGDATHALVASTQYTIRGLKPGTVHTFTVTAQQGSTAGAPSAPVTIHTPTH